MTNHRVRTVLIGTSETRAGKLLAVSLGLLVGLYVLLTFTGGLGDALNKRLGRGYNLVFFMLILLIVAAISSYLYNGVIISVVLVAAPLMGFFLSGNLAFARDPTLLEYTQLVLEGGFLYGAPIGILGYLLGRGLTHFQGTQSDSYSVESR
ncbi:hypothetical protein ACFO5R_19960 [Halosolutus amylolyticus]|uniref:Major facilitator superfamily (MFS) profile domain-containing protein n=1 Tax=Halosolutus amylolyticus TaxID=2932267 RepID=A0ABD5PUB0_9EURY|nr:hypothetical protein [Halosolutus amylolyticus]